MRPRTQGYASALPDRSRHAPPFRSRRPGRESGQPDVSPPYVCDEVNNILGLKSPTATAAPRTARTGTAAADGPRRPGRRAVPSLWSRRPHKRRDWRATRDLADVKLGWLTWHFHNWRASLVEERVVCQLAPTGESLEGPRRPRRRISLTPASSGLMIEWRTVAMNVANVAVAYATFGGLLVGFAFTGLCLYLQGQKGKKSPVKFLTPRSWVPVILKRVKVSAVAAAGFYAMTSLGMSTFLYANLSGNDDPTVLGRAVAAMLPYGALLALSVLTLFYFVTLMMLRQPRTVQAARPAFWTTTIAGSVVVLSFLAGSARDAVCASTIVAEAAYKASTASNGNVKPPSPPAPCHPSWIFSFPSIAVGLFLAAALFAVITWTRVVESRVLGWFLAWCTNRPEAPPMGVFIVTFIVTAWGSVYLNTRPGGYSINMTILPDGQVVGPYEPGHLLVYMGLGIGFLLVGLFALASGCVVYPRIYRNHSLSPARTDGVQQLPREVRQFKSVEGARPTARRKHLVWKIPGNIPGQVTDETTVTKFTLAQPLEGGVQFRGLLYVTAEKISRDNPREIIMTWKTCSAEKSSDFGHRVSSNDRFKQWWKFFGRKGVWIDERISGGVDTFKVSLCRLDQNTDTILVCWFRPEILRVSNGLHERKLRILKSRKR